MTTEPFLAIDHTALSPQQAEFRRLRRDAFQSRGFDARECYVLGHDGRKIHVLTAGEGDCATLLIHAGVGNTAEWAQVAPLLPGPVVIPDTPGHGLSERPAAGYRDMAAFSASWIRAIVDALKVDRVNIVGCSMGGFGAINFALAEPERVNRLVVAGAAGGLLTDIGTFLKLWTVPGLGKIVSNAPLRDTTAIRKLMLGPYVADASSIPEDLCAVALAGVNLPGARAASREMIRAVANTRGWKPECRVDDALLGSDVPTTFVWGDHDIHGNASIAVDLASRMANAKAVILPGAGHIPHLDHPAEVAREIG